MQRYEDVKEGLQYHQQMIMGYKHRAKYFWRGLYLYLYTPCSAKVLKDLFKRSVWAEPHG